MATVKASPEIFTERRGRVAIITLNRPDSLNALSISMRAPLLEAFEGASRDSAVGAIVVTGAGRAFSSGGDITFMESVMAEGERARRRNRGNQEIGETRPRLYSRTSSEA